MPISLFAYSDLIDSVIQYAGSNPATQGAQQANRAAMMAYLGLVKVHDWSFYKRVFSIPTAAPYSTGTTAYDQTGGGTCERQLTLTGGTWPTWAAYGYVQMGMKTFQVQKYHSASVIELSEVNNPGSDIAAGEVYTLYRDLYPLPLDFTEAMNAVTQPGGISLVYVPIAQWAYGRDYYLNASRPVAFTVTKDLTVPQRQACRLWPAPDQDSYSILFTYKANLMPPVYRKVSDGSVTVTANSTTVTGVGTAFETAMAGTVLRVSKDGNTSLPTGLEGDNPPYVEAVIDSVTNATTLVLQEAPTLSVTRGKYQISSLLDCDQYAMKEYLYAECRRQFRSMARMLPIAGEAGDWDMARRMAMDADSRYAGWKGASPYRPLLTIFDVASLPYSTT